MATTGADVGDCSNIITPCLTINYAISQSAASDTINVGPGTYAENVSVPATLAGLTLKGAQAGVPVAGRTASGPLESTVNGSGGQTAIAVSATNVTIDGFSITDTQATFAVFGIDVKSVADNVLIQNNILDTIITNDPGVNSTAQGVYLDVGPDSAQILNNRFNNILSGRSAKGVLIGDSSSADPSDNDVITGNMFTAITSLNRGAYAVQVNNAAGSSGLQILNNTSSGFAGTNGGSWIHAIGLETNTPGAVVTGNSFSGFTSPPSGGTPTSFDVFFENNPGYTNNLVNQNNFNQPTTSFGIAVDPTLGAGGGTVDGTCNWWGDPSGPGQIASGTGALVSNNVTYSPFDIAPAPAGPCGTPTPSPTPVVTASPTPTPTPVVTASPTPTPVVTASPTPTPVVTASPTPSPTVIGATATPAGTPAVGGLVDVVTTGGTGSSAAGMSIYALLGLILATAVSGTGLYAYVRRRI
ncbi:MAG: hypothetical protein ABI559_08240 [Chloroflexota bacterium]